MREVLLERDFPCVGTATVTLNRADRGNALTSASLSTLLRLLEELQNDKTVFAVVLTGAGKYFCTGMVRAKKERKRLREKTNLLLSFHSTNKGSFRKFFGR